MLLFGTWASLVEATVCCGPHQLVEADDDNMKKYSMPSVIQGFFWLYNFFKKNCIFLITYIVNLN